MYTNKRFFIIFSQICLLICNLFVFIASICLLNYYGIFSLSSDCTPTFTQKLFIILFSFSTFSLTFFIIPLIIDIVSFIHSYRVKKRDILVKEIYLRVRHNLPCCSYSEIKKYEIVKK